MGLVIPLTWLEINNGFSKTTSNYKTVYKVDADVSNFLWQQNRFGLLFPMLLMTNGATHITTLLKCLFLLTQTSNQMTLWMPSDPFFPSFKCHFENDI